MPPARGTGAIVETPLRIPALDGHSLGATLYAPAGAAEPGIAVVFNSGGGVPAGRYARFARYLAANGIPILTYDYRGIGASRPARLRGFHASAEDWSESDCGGAIAHMRLTYPRAELVGMAHSIGALLMGGAPNVAEISRFVFISAHTGYSGDYLRKYRLPMALLWHVFMPAVTQVIGFFPARALRIGEDIPRRVAMQWAARRSPDLRAQPTGANAARARSMIDRYRALKGTALLIGFTDDAFATEAGARRVLALFPGLRAELVFRAPGSAGMAAIGHFGFFRREAEAGLWPMVTAHLRTAAKSI